MNATKRQNTKKEIITLIIIFIFLGIGIFLAFKNFMGESEKKPIYLSSLSEDTQQGLGMYIRLVGINPITGEASARIEFDAQGSLMAEDTTLAHNIKVYLPTADKKTEFEFKKGTHIAPIDVTFSIDGNVGYYPFDEHKTTFDIFADVSESTENEGSGTWTTLPIEVSFTGALPGYRIDATKDPKSRATWVGASLIASRSLASIAFSCFVMLVFWSLSIAVLFMILVVIFHKEEIDSRTFAFMSALIFAFYGIRNGQPNVPPIGVLSDFIAFFWAEIIVAGSLFAGILVWLFRVHGIENKESKENQQLL